ncbi:hypothetical protein C8R43DRAFT_296502 [Mycena crocata]|nr:hypothetical protein C8R43DRAFT_296502 [Mycena crocata]
MPYTIYLFHPSLGLSHMVRRFEADHSFPVCRPLIYRFISCMTLPLTCLNFSTFNFRLCFPRYPDTYATIHIFAEFHLNSFAKICRAARPFFARALLKSLATTLNHGCFFFIILNVSILLSWFNELDLNTRFEQKKAIFDANLPERSEGASCPLINNSRSRV